MKQEGHKNAVKRIACFPVILIALTSVAAASVVFFCSCVPSVAAQSSAQRLPDLLAAAAGQKVLVFSPHPDDESIAVGGYIAQSVKNGADVRIVLVTDGNFHHNEATRYAEFRAATAILGVPKANLVFLGFPDHGLASEDPAKLRAALQDQADRYQPNIVIYPSPCDYNPDHATIGRLMESILAGSPSQLHRYEYVVHYKLVYPRPYSWAFNTRLYLLPPTRLVKVDKEWMKVPLPRDVATLKEKAILSYDSQLDSPELSGLMHSFVRRNELLGVPPP